VAATVLFVYRFIAAALFLASGVCFVFWLLLPHHPYLLVVLGVLVFLVGLGVFVYPEYEWARR
jgi:hypothetical protein